MTIVCDPDPSVAAALASCTDDGDTVRTVADLPDIAHVLVDGNAESVVVIGPGVDLAEALAFVSGLGPDLRSVGVILVRNTLNDTVRDLAVHRGVRDIICTSELPMLPEVCRRVRHPHRCATIPPDRPIASRIVAVIGAGGQGKTTVAANLAVVLNAAAWRVCVVDLDLVSGDLTYQLAGRHLHPSRHGDSGVVAAGRSSLVVPYLPGLDCVFAPDRPGAAEPVPPDRTEAVLSGLASGYDYVIVDTPARYSGQVLSVLDCAHHHLVVAGTERPALRNLRRTLDMLDLLGYPHGSRSIVLNRCDPRVTPTATEIDVVVRNPIAARLPSTVDVPVSINQGVPLAVSRPEHPFTRAVHRFTGALLSTVTAEGRLT